MLHHQPFFDSPLESQIIRQFEQQNFSISLWTTKADIVIGCFLIDNQIYHPHVKEGPPKLYYFDKSVCYWLKNLEFHTEPNRWTKILVVFPSITTKITRWKRGTMKDAFFQQKVWVSSRSNKKFVWNQSANDVKGSFFHLTTQIISWKPLTAKFVWL